MSRNSSLKSLARGSPLRVRSRWTTRITMMTMITMMERTWNTLQRICKGLPGSDSSQSRVCARLIPSKSTRIEIFYVINIWKTIKVTGRRYVYVCSTYLWIKHDLDSVAPGALEDLQTDPTPTHRKYTHPNIYISHLRHNDEILWRVQHEIWMGISGRGAAITSPSSPSEHEWGVEWGRMRSNVCPNQGRTHEATRPAARRLVQRIDAQAPAALASGLRLGKELGLSWRGRQCEG